MIKKERLMLCYTIPSTSAVRIFTKKASTRFFGQKTLHLPKNYWQNGLKVYCGLVPFEKCAGTMRNWFAGITNSFDSNITNGFTEGCNNKIKVLKRNAYGYRNFNRFRNRILHMFYYKSLIQNKAAA